MTGTPFRVATWNILGRRVAGTHDVARAGAVRSIIDRHPVDILCLQEVHFYDDEPDGQLVDELSSAGLGHFVGSPLSKSHLDRSAGLGIGIASATPLSQPVMFQLSNPGLRASVRGEQWVLHDKGMLGCAVQIPDGREIQVYSLHLFPFHEFGVADNDHMVDAMWSEFWDYADKRVDSGELILAGDFNQVSREGAARRWSRNKWQFLLNDLVTTSFGLPPRRDRTELVASVFWRPVGAHLLRPPSGHRGCPTLTCAGGYGLAMRRTPVLLGMLAVVLVVLAWSAVRPYRWETWFFETVWVVAGLAVVLAVWRRFPLTTLLCTVLALHAVVLAYGGHYTYARAPLGGWAQEVFGLARNPYDRVGHFMQGFGPAVAVREILWRTSPLRGSGWLGPLTVAMCLALSAFWELLEWCGAYLVAGGDPAFLGAQGDPWDTQWDMALALVGAFAALTLLSRWHDRQLATSFRPGSRMTALASRRRFTQGSGCVP